MKLTEITETETGDYRTRKPSIKSGGTCAYLGIKIIWKNTV